VAAKTAATRVWSETRDTWQRVAIELAPSIGRVITLGEIAAALTAVAIRDLDAVREELRR
jgi:hypothetical protein